MSATDDSAIATIDGPARELLSFRLGSQEFCLDIMVAREVRGWTPAIPLPHAPAYVQGVINLRGTVLPVLDLAGLLGLAATQPTASHVIIVAEIGRRLVGLLVTAVCDILTVKDEAIQPPPDFASDRARACLRGLLTVQGRMVSLLRTDQLLPQTSAADRYASA